MNEHPGNPLAHDSAFSRTLSMALSYRDMNTRLHSDRVGLLAVAMGRRCRLAADELAPLGIGAMFHDIGKIGIPDDILKKPGQLDPAERRQMHHHPIIGEEILLAAQTPETTAAARLVRHHHENFDGQGYPDGLQGEDIPLGARIISIADNYDAMMERRVYRAAGSHRQVISTMRAGSGSKFDPYLLRVFCELIEDIELRDD